ncbi:divalent-cation tolerance protein CutA [Candidatus Woesearchaeota archaeon]|nr:divalent-cation tolerance protein CutA [Candidatus Woesearchaeota archaeon]
MNTIIVYVPCKSRAEAAKIAKALLQKKLVACANVLQSSSFFRWKNKLVADKEAILLLKTRKSLQKKVEREILHLHSYELPCILAFSGKANKRFEQWIEEETLE